MAFAPKIPESKHGQTPPGQSFFQPKLMVNAPDDGLEQEADTMSEKVMLMTQTSENSVQRSPSHQQGCSCPNCSSKLPNIQRKESKTEPDDSPEVQADEEEQEDIGHVDSDSDNEEEEQDSTQQQLQTKPSAQNAAQGGASPAPQHLSTALNETKGSGSTLPNNTMSVMEQAIGADFSQVRLHTDEKAAGMSDSVQARAFTYGQDIYFNKNQYQPETNEGKRLLAHELTHVAQQKSPQTIRRSFFGKVWGGIKKAASWVGDKASKGIKAIGKGASWLGSKIWKGTKWLGDKVWKGAKWLGDKVWKGVKWLGKQLIDKISGVFQRIANWITQLPARIGRLMKGLLEGLKSFKPWTLSWWKSLAKADTWKNFLKWVGSRLIDILEIAGIGEAYETIMDFIKFNTRTLNDEERTAAERLFGSSINLNLVRVDEAAFIGPLFSDRAYTSFHTINSWGKETVDVMMHELTHVWQYETSGAIYMPQAIHAQVWGKGYDYGGITGLQKAKTAGKGFLSFNREQQAQIVQDFFQLKQANIGTTDPTVLANLSLYADFVVTVSTLTKAQLLAS